MASVYDSLNNSELRQKLLDIGYDLPTSVKKEFLIKTLKRVTQEKRKQQLLQGRKSMPAMPTSRYATTPASNNNHSPPLQLRRPGLLVYFIVVVVGVLGAYYYKASVFHGPEGDGDLNAFFGGQGKASKSPIAAPTKPKRTRPPTKFVYPICGKSGYETAPFCVEISIIRDSIKLFEALKSELTRQSERKGCGDFVEAKISLLRAKELLYRLVDMKKSKVDTAFNGMLMLVIENPASGVRIFGDGITEDVKIQDIATLNNEQFSITVEGVSPTFYCMIVGFIFSVVMYISCLLFVSILGYGVYKAIRYRQQRQARDDEEMLSMIDRVVNMLHQQYEATKNANGQDQKFLAVHHIRDAMLSPRDRKLKEALWTKVVAEISTNESRVREEIQNLGGEEFKVWRWLPSASPISK